MKTKLTKLNPLRWITSRNALIPLAILSDLSDIFLAPIYPVTVGIDGIMYALIFNQSKPGVSVIKFIMFIESIPVVGGLPIMTLVAIETLRKK